MAMVINTNIMSMNAQNNLRTSQSDMNTAMERLSSGKRVNSAADDAAGLAIINRFTSQERGLNMAIRNANDGISMIQTAEGALDETTNILQRMRELAIQSANGIYSDANRSTLNAEVTQLKAELTRIAETTSFNGLKILDGTLGDLDLQVGAESGEQIRVNLGSGFDAESLGAPKDTISSGTYTLAEQDGTSVAGLTSALPSLDDGDLEINGVAVPAASTESDPYAGGRSAISIAEAINTVSDQTGVVAEANNAVFDMAASTFAAAGAATTNLDINGVNIGVAAGNTQVNYIDAINAKTSETGVIATAISTTGIKLTSVDGRNINLDFGDAAAAGLTGTGSTYVASNGDNVTGTGSVTLRANEEFTISGNSPTDAGFSTGTVSLDVTALQTVDQTSAATIAATFESLGQGDLTINGYSVDFSLALTDANEQSDIERNDSAMYIAAAINNTDGLKSEVVATATTVANLGTVSALTAEAAFEIKINGVAMDFDSQAIAAGDATGAVVGEFNSKFAAAATDSDIEGLVASINDAGELIITAEDGRNISLEVVSADVSSTQVFSNWDTTTANKVVAKGTVSVSAKEGFSLGEIGGEKRSLAGIDTSSQGTISSIDISTQSGAQAALDVVDRALDYIADARGDLGAASNRLSFTINNLSSVVENSAAARSRVQDADFAMESASLARAQVLQQAGTAMLAQANAAPQSVLSLLQ